MARPQIPLRRPLAWTLDRVVVAYQRWISPLTPPACRFHPSCSVYARDALASHGLGRALSLTAWRLLRCQPFSKGGLDPVPPGPHRLSCHHHVDGHPSPDPQSREPQSPDPQSREPQSRALQTREPQSGTLQSGTLQSREPQSANERRAADHASIRSKEPAHQVDAAAPADIMAPTASHHHTFLSALGSCSSPQVDEARL